MSKNNNSKSYDYSETIHFLVPPIKKGMPMPEVKPPKKSGDEEKCRKDESQKK